jgi:signal transduction histidine kinase
VSAISDNGEFRLSVSNAGKKIPAAAMELLFHPFSRGEVKPGKQGLGLGLYIASEIAAAHDGKLDVTSTNDETTFTLSMPSVRSSN